MKRSILLIGFLFVVGIFALSNTAQPQSPTPTILELTPGEVKWMPSPALPPGAQVAVVYGNPLKAGLYVLLVKFPPNWKNPPHSHPIEQIATVLSGTVYSGLGESYDPKKLKMFPAGSVYTEPLNTPHFTETREEGAILQATGIGPLGTQYVNPADDPRKK
jgi:quercetin dioxygenase-like cupin family protein